MTDRIFIKPRAGLTVRDPDAGGAPLPPQGKAVTWSSFWERRQADGDIEPTTEKAVEAATRKAEPAVPATKGDA